ncbi:hypothetical protein [Calothrix sp. UHCC 0171]|uniref:hypothetical protein n=1 Tax=Calothrix sp. UHCC 0171 TaxID=3110245 RepID=UPI002B207387|nr:hypothetical protein [Calothrix sp. UHCC 0171]MEA5571770.1 hypothetical protein [Calothrix sp. UHCC 0171]
MIQWLIKCLFLITKPDLALGVEDNGIGIAPEYKEQIFDVLKRFYGGDLYQ